MLVHNKHLLFNTHGMNITVQASFSRVYTFEADERLYYLILVWIFQ